MSHKAKILIADDDSTVLTALRMLLQNKGYQVTQVTQPNEVLYYLEKQHFDLLLMDLNYQLDTTSGNEGLSLISAIRNINDAIPIVVMTGWASVDIAVTAMQNGANDFVQKPWDNRRLINLLSTHLKLADSLQNESRLNEENALLRAALLDQGSDFVAESDAMKALLQQANTLAMSDANVLITGENGCGKSLFAKYLHQRSGRSEGPLISVNMGSIPENLFESEMFGHVKGAFTDAKTQRIGRLELAQHGTLFMDEVGNIPMSQQAKLLRVLEERQFEKVGASITQRADFRVISATNADINLMVEEKTFRMDLLYRLNTTLLRIPALRERAEDIPILARNFVDQFAQKYHKPALTLSENALNALINYPWPGNVRELSHVIERAVIFSDTETISASHLTLDEQPGAPKKTANNIALAREEMSLEDIEKEVIVKRLAIFGGNANDTAESLGLSRSAFYRRLDKYGL